jgi:non-heme chloroperoxidase
MPYVTVGEENPGPIELYYEDHGSGRPVVLIHAYALSGRAWDRQVPVLLEDGQRVITYDRRGFGKSSQPVTGYDYDTLASDLRTLLETLDLRDVTLVAGQSCMDKGIPGQHLQHRHAPRQPRQQPGVSRQLERCHVRLGHRPVECLRTWQTDFRADLPKIEVPMLVIQGDRDEAVPYPKGGQRLPGLIKDARLVVIDGGPHTIPWSHAAQVSAALLSFIGAHSDAVGPLV